MMTLEALANHVAALTGLVVGQTLFAGQRPANAPDDCVVLLERTGGIIDDQTRIHQWPIQILARGERYHGASGARQRCWNVFNALNNKQAVTVGGFAYSATGISPASIGQDDRGRHEFSANLVLRIKG